jgi:integrase/recombinase XerD
MASVKIVLRKKENKDGTYPLAVRITKDRKSSYVHTGHHIVESFWDSVNRKVKKSHPNSVRLNNLLSKKLAEAEDNLLDMEVQKNDISSRVIKSRLKASKECSFFAQGGIHLAGLKKQGKYNQYRNDEGRINAFRKFLNGSDISFQQITLTLLKKYRAFLKAKKLSEYTVVNYLKIIH